MASQLAMTGLRQHARDAKHDRPFFALNLIWRHFLEVDNRAGQAAKMDGYRCPSRLVGCDDAGLMSALPGVRSPCVYTLEVEFGTDELFESRFFRPPKGGVCVTQKITELQYMRHTPHAKQPSWRRHVPPTTACSKGGDHSVCATTATIPTSLAACFPATPISGGSSCSLRTKLPPFFVVRKGSGWTIWLMLISNRVVSYCVVARAHHMPGSLPPTSAQMICCDSK